MSDNRPDLMRRAAGRARRAAGRAKRRMFAASPVDAPELSKDEALLMESPLFDHEFYGAQLDRPMGRLQAVRHYLGSDQSATRPTPNPFFAPGYFVDMLSPAVAEELGETDPFLFYLRRGKFAATRTHPTFEAPFYARRYRKSAKYPGGPLAHYVDVGIGKGLRFNDWWPAGEDGRLPDFRQFLLDGLVRERAAANRPKAWVGSIDVDAATSLQATLKGRHVESEAPVLVTVLLDAGLDQALFSETLSSLGAQTESRWEVVALDRGKIRGLENELQRLPQPSVVLGMSADEPQEAISAAFARATGTYVAFLRAGETWDPDRLRLTTLVAADGGHDAVIDVLSKELDNGGRRFARAQQPVVPLHRRELIEFSRIVMSAAHARRVGIRNNLRNDYLTDFTRRAILAGDVAYLPSIGTFRKESEVGTAHRLPPSQRPPVDHSALTTWSDVALNEVLIDWRELAERPRRNGVVSVIIPTFQDFRMTIAAVDSVMASADTDDVPVEVIVWNNGSIPLVGANLTALSVHYPSLVMLGSPVNHGFALGNNRALAEATGEFVMFLNNDTTVSPGWLDPIVAALADPAIAGAQSLLVYPTGSVQSAGVAFPAVGGIPHAFLAGFPVEDTEGIERLDFHALTGAALAVRVSDAIAVRGFDPIFANGMEDVDFCHRLRAHREGRLVVLGQSPVVHYESRTPGRFRRHLVNRALYLERWQGVVEPRDDVAKYAASGYTVIDHQVIPRSTTKDRNLLVNEPVLVRSARIEVHDRPRSLRWAIKNPAPSGHRGEHWGDTHFARALAAALRDQGQEVVTDNRGDFHRDSSRHDDVSLVLRGLEPFSPSSDQISIGWVISHPDMLSWSEAAAYDRLVAASIPWSRKMSERWHLRIDPLLQATDPSRFHPDLAVPDTGHPALFVGSSRRVYRTIVRDAVAAGLPLSIYGDAWRPFVDKRYIKAEYLPNADLGAAYRSAGVVLNDHWDDMRGEGFLSNRLFDAVAAGARIITDDVAGLRDVFGSTVQTYETTEDLARMSSLLDPSTVFGSDDHIRSEAARIAKEHSFAARASELIQIAHEERAKRGFIR